MAKCKLIRSSIPAKNCMMSDNVTSVEDMVTTDGVHNVDLNTPYISAREYCNYFKIGKLVVVNLGGIIDSTGTATMTICSGLPVMRSRALAIVQNDSDVSKSAIIYGMVGSSWLAFATHDANVAYYGQVVYYTD